MSESRLSDWESRRCAAGARAGATRISTRNGPKTFPGKGAPDRFRLSGRHLKGVRSNRRLPVGAGVSGPGRQLSTAREGFEERLERRRLPARGRDERAVEEGAF